MRKLNSIILSMMMASCGVFLFCVDTVHAQAKELGIDDPITEIRNMIPPNLPKLQVDFKTLGGRQFWGDVHYYRGYRIQQNVITGHYRLLTPDDVRKEWGTLDECRIALAKIADDLQLPPMQGRAVIFIHGIVRSSKSFSKMARNVSADDEVTIVQFDYPSTRVTMEESAKYLAKTIDSLEGIEQIDLVCHSMGGLLVRSYLQSAGEKVDPRLRRLVMLGTPNQGAEMASLLKNNLAFKWIFGPAGQELIDDPQGVIALLPVPLFEFGIIAGARGTEGGWNPLIPGDDDGTVALRSAQLPGAKDFMTVGCLHSFLPDDQRVIDSTCRFLNTGAFRESGICVPVTREELRIEQPESNEIENKE